MYDELEDTQGPAAPSILEQFSVLLDQKIAAALQSKQEKPLDEHKVKTVQAMQEMIRKVQLGDVTGLAIVSVGPNPQPAYAYSDGQTGMGALIGEIELLKGRIVSSLIAPQQQPQA
jgi:hypothetical protein